MCVTHSERSADRPWKVSLSISPMQLCWKFLQTENKNLVTASLSCTFFS